MHDNHDSVGEQTEQPQPIVFSRHAREQMAERGASEAELIETIRVGEEVPARGNRQGYRRNFQYDATWGGHQYAI